MLEYTLLLPFMLLAIVALFDLGRLVFAYTVLSNAAREGARFASVLDSGQQTAIRNYILGNAPYQGRLPGIDPSDVTVTISWTDCSKVIIPGTSTEISKPGEVSIQLGYLQDSILLGDNLTANADVTMRMENCP